MVLNIHLTNTEAELVKRLVDYKKGNYKQKLENDIELLPEYAKYNPDNGWLFARFIAKGIINIAHRQMYLEDILIKQKKLLERKNIKFKNIKKKRITERGLYVYRLKKDEETLKKLILFFYTKEGSTNPFFDSDYTKEREITKILEKMLCSFRNDLKGIFPFGVEKCYQTLIMARLFVFYLIDRNKCINLLKRLEIIFDRAKIKTSERWNLIIFCEVLDKYLTHFFDTQEVYEEVESELVDLLQNLKNTKGG